jgi:hypothetical protein
MPRCVLLPSIADRPTSQLSPVDATDALPALLQQMQPPALLPPHTAQAQLDRVAALLRPCETYRLTAGRDLYHDPGALADLLPSRLEPTEPGRVGNA